jgi:hypothetical protein
MGWGLMVVDLVVSFASIVWTLYLLKVSHLHVRVCLSAHVCVCVCACVCVTSWLSSVTYNLPCRATNNCTCVVLPAPDVRG